MASALEDEMQKKYPQIKGRIAVLCGDDAIDFARQNIEHYFGKLVEDISGYRDLQDLKKKIGDDCVND